ncbi:hypothetical protein DICVIV_14172, partial [Dictyocaulus viviparus]
MNDILLILVNCWATFEHCCHGLTVHTLKKEVDLK